MTDNPQETVIVLFEGQQYQVPTAIADSDDKLRALLAPFASAAANALIRRTPGRPIEIVKQAEPKGTEPLTYLRTQPEWINPAVLAARQVQHLELSGGVDPQQMKRLSESCEQAAKAGQAAAEFSQASLSACRRSQSCPAPFLFISF